MICLYFRDESERAHALVSISRRCRALDARLVFFGSRSACTRVRNSVRRLEPACMRGIGFRSLHVPRGRSRDTWNATIEAVRSALLEISALEGLVVAWIEGQVPPGAPAARDVLRRYHDSLREVAGGASPTVINAYRLAEVPEGAREALLEMSEAVISAKRVIQCCPSWLLVRRQTSDDVVPVTGFPGSPQDADLRATERLLSEKLVALGQLAAAVAHELVNPLSIVSSSLQYLHQRLSAANDAASDFTMTALQNVERMHGLLRNMLDGAAARKPPFRQVNLNETLSEVLRFVSAECARRSIHVEVSFDPSLPRPWVDPGGIGEIFLNLVKNALEALTESGDMLTVRTRATADRSQAVVEIEHNGPCIPEDVLRYLFRPFQTARRSGTGVWLYLSRQIAKIHRGDLDAENLPSGVRFTVVLPVDQWAERSEASGIEAGSFAAEARDDRQKGGDDGACPDCR